MNWEAIGSIAELVGAAGVIFSLGYLAVQIRSSNIEFREGNADEYSRQWNELTSKLATNEKLAAIFIAGIQDFDSLDAVSKVMFSAHLVGIMRVAEGMHRRILSGRIDQDMWNSMDKFVGEALSYPGVQAWWKTREDWFSPTFRQEIEQLIKRDKAPSLYGEH